tara:strand:+ start:111 stop:335 length:225 start_codon:yes stop_codon:yes gene_type:complete
MATYRVEEFGDEVQDFKTQSAADDCIAKFESEDKANGVFEPGRYKVRKLESQPVARSTLDVYDPHGEWGYSFQP